MKANLLLMYQCTITDVDQTDGSLTEVIRNLACSELFGYSFRQVRANTALDIKPITIFTEPPPRDVTIKENMRLIFNEIDYRIHSVEKWPMGCPKFVELRLQSDGNG